MAHYQVDERALGEDTLKRMERIVPLTLLQGSNEQIAALQERQSLLQHIVAVLAKSAAGSGSSISQPALQEVQDRCASLAGEVSALRQALEATKAQLHLSQERVETLEEQLRQAERRADRAQSDVVRNMEDPKHEKQAQASAQPASNQGTPTPTPADHKESAQGSESHAEAAQGTMAATAEKAAAMEEELSSLRDVAHSRQRLLDEARAELLEAKQSVAALQLQMQAVPDERVHAHSVYHALQAEMVFMQQEAERLRSAHAALEQENNDMREFRFEFQRQTTTQAQTHSEELQKQIKARDADIVRLRGQRDELNAELLERRARESVRFTYVDEAKALLAPKDERLAAFEAQVQRLQAELAAAKNDAAGVEAALGDGATEASLSTDVAQLQLQLKAANAASMTLCDEVDRLSSAYDQLDKQTSARIANVERLEDKMLRVTTEKAKADNKYFAAMRAKDALEVEKRALARSAERQAKVIERYTEAEKGLQTQVAQAEKEISALRRSLQTHTSKLAEADRDVAVWRRRHADAERARAAAEASVSKHLATAEQETSARHKAEERMMALDRDVGRLRRRLAESSTSSRRRESSDADTHLEYLNSLLRCSSCKERYRDRIITRCFHTFCEACINARLQTRQRKCPHCGLAFASSDVQALYCTYSRHLHQCNNDYDVSRLRREFVHGINEARSHFIEQDRRYRRCGVQTVYRSHGASLAGARVGVLHTLFQVGNEAIDDRHSETCACNVEGWCVAANRIQVPTTT